MSRRFWACLPLLLSVFLVACGSDPAVTSLVITPSSASLNVGATTQFKATASFVKSNQTQFTQDVTSQVDWSSSNPLVATIASTGLATARTAGSTTIVATLKSGSNASTNSAGVTVTGTPPALLHELLSISVTPSTQTVTAVGQTAQFIAIGTFSTPPTTEDMTTRVQWRSSSPQVATVNSSGVAIGVGPGVATITATGTAGSGASLVGSAVLTETGTIPVSRDLVSVSIIPTSQTLSSLNQTAKFTAVGTFTSAPVTAVIDNATWGSSVKEVATIDSTGLATATGPGTTAITATAPTLSGAKIAGTATLTEQAAIVTKRELLSVSIIPTAQTVTDAGDTAQFIAVGTYSSAPVTDLLVSGLTWASSVVQVATIDPVTGLATAVGPGNTTITAIAPSASGANLVGQATLSLGVGPSQLPVLTVVKLGTGAATATITSDPTSISCGSTCSATFPLGSTVTLTANPIPASWSTNCTVSPDGSACTVTMSTNTTVAAVFN